MKTNTNEIENGMKALKARGNKLSELVCDVCTKLDLRTDDNADWVSAEDILATGLVSQDEAAALFFCLCEGTRCNFDAAAHVVNFGW